MLPDATANVTKLVALTQLQNELRREGGLPTITDSPNTAQLLAMMRRDIARKRGENA